MLSEAKKFVAANLLIGPEVKGAYRSKFAPSVEAVHVETIKDGLACYLAPYGPCSDKLVKDTIEEMLKDASELSMLVFEKKLKKLVILVFGKTCTIYFDCATDVSSGLIKT